MGLGRWCPLSDMKLVYLHDRWGKLSNLTESCALLESAYRSSQARDEGLRLGFPLLQLPLLVLRRSYSSMLRLVRKAIAIVSEESPRDLRNDQIHQLTTKCLTVLLGISLWPLAEYLESCHRSKCTGLTRDLGACQTGYGGNEI